MSSSTAPTAGGPRRPGEVKVPERLRHLPLDERGYPIIATIPQTPGQVNFGALSEARKLVVATYDLCGVCAHPFTEDDLRWQVTFVEEEDGEDLSASSDLSSVRGAAGDTFNESPVHRICALYAAQVCPFVSSPYARHTDERRRGHRRASVLLLLGYRTTEVVRVESSLLQPGVGVLMYDMGGHEDTMVMRSAAEAQAAYEVALAADGPVVLDGPTQALVTQISAPNEFNEDAGKVLAGGACAIGAAFLEDGGKLQGLSIFDTPDSPYRVIAASLAHKPGSFASEDSNDPHMEVALRWRATRERLPATLAGWVEGARRTTRLASPGGPGASSARSAGTSGSGGSAKKQGAKRVKAPRKAQRAARRKNSR